MAPLHHECTCSSAVHRCRFSFTGWRVFPLHASGLHGADGQPAVVMFLKPTADFATNRVPASAWIARWTHLVAPNAHVLDVACGAGRHLAWFAERGHLVTGIDREFAATPDLLDRFTLVCSDLESEPWPLLSDGVPDQFGAVVVTNYLWRPLMPT